MIDIQQKIGNAKPANMPVSLAIKTISALLRVKDLSDTRRGLHCTEVYSKLPGSSGSGSTCKAVPYILCSSFLM